MKKKLLKVRKILEDCYYAGKLHKLTPIEIEDLTYCYNELCVKAYTETMSCKVAQLFEKNGFTVALKGIGYSICA